MRSKEVENSIKREDRIKNIINRAKEIYDERKEPSSEPSLEQCLAIDILNLGKYISELEEENKKYKNFQLHINGMRSGKELLIKYINDSILKDKIRDKIKELEENGYWEFLEQRDLEETIGILKLIIGE